MSYDAFKVLAFTYGVNPQPLEVVRPWVLKELGSDPLMWNTTDDLGFAELRSIDSIDIAMDALKDIVWRSTLMETPKKTQRALEKFYKDAGGREGKGFYRYALKAYYLTLPKYDDIQ